MQLAIIASIVLASPYLVRQPQTPEQALDRAVAAYAKVRTVRASFNQTVKNPLTGSTLASRGELQQRIPGQLSVRFAHPAGDVIVADGKAVWIYVPSTAPGQVIKLRSGDGISTPDVTAQFLRQPKARYTVSAAGRDIVEGRPATAIQLVPKQSGMPFSKAVIWVDDADGSVRQFETMQANGIVRRVTITKLTLNGRVDPEVFSFEIPKGVKVFDQTGTGG